MSLSVHFLKNKSVDHYQALTAADIGIAMGSGSKSLRCDYAIVITDPFIGDVAISSASFVLLSADLRSLLTLSDLSRKVFNRVKLNFVGGCLSVYGLPITSQWYNSALCGGI